MAQKCGFINKIIGYLITLSAGSKRLAIDALKESAWVALMGGCVKKIVIGFVTGLANI